MGWFTNWPLNAADFHFVYKMNTAYSGNSLHKSMDPDRCGFLPCVKSCVCAAEFENNNQCIRPPKKNKNKKKICFTDRQICQIGSVGRRFFCFVFFLFLVAKMTLKTLKFKKKKRIWHFFTETFWENILTYFQKFSAKIFRFWSKNSWFYKILEKKNLPKRKIWVGRTCKTGFFFCGLSTQMHKKWRRTKSIARLYTTSSTNANLDLWFTI